MTASDYKLFSNLVAASQNALHQTLSAYLGKYYNQIKINDKFIYAVGDIPVALVAHLDTVFPTPVKEIYFDKEKNVIWSPNGLGADDRAGIFLIIKILQITSFRPSIILLKDEEQGCIGADAFILNYPNPLTDLKYIIELDRSGKDDCVFYECDNKEFVKYVESFGFKEKLGSFTDISSICPAWKIAGVNLSVGYYREHSYLEILKPDYMFETFHKVYDMLDKIQSSDSFEYIPRYNFSSDSFQYPINCYKCGKTISLYNSIPVKKLDKTEDRVCFDCIEKDIDWCSFCGRAHETDDNSPIGICDECLEREMNHV